VAQRASLLYFCIIDLRHVDSMYQYSLGWFTQLTAKLITAAPKSAVLEERLKHLIDYITLKVFKNVSNSLFGKHQLMFAFLIAVRIALEEGVFTETEWTFLLTGTAGNAEIPANTMSELIPDSMWAELFNLSELAALKGFHAFACEHWAEVRKIEDIFRGELGGDYNGLSLFQRLLVARALQPDALIDGFRLVVERTLGLDFLESEPANINNAYQDSGPTTPIVFILSAGTDPAADISHFAGISGASDRLKSLSLGQGQGTRATEMIENGRIEGHWVLLQNCHLATSWMPKLEEILQGLHEAHAEFRLWLTSMPSVHFPVSILQNSSKLTTEAPQGLKATMKELLQDAGQRALRECPREQEFKSLFFALCFFHGVVLGRRRFGPLGWNIRYEWTKGDLDISRKQLNLYLGEMPVGGELPFKTLRFLAGEINYGGRVTDDWDRRTLLTLAQDFYNQGAMKPGFEIAPGFKTPPPLTLAEYLDEVAKYPISDAPELFGLHGNAELTLRQTISFALLNDVLMTRPRGGGSGGADLATIVNGLLRRVPGRLDLKAIVAKYPTIYEESMNTVLQQEAVRYNDLLKLVRSSMKALLKAMKGLIVFSAELEEMGAALSQNLVPPNWAAIAYPSLKPLNLWMADLNERLKFLRDWAEQGQPPCFWISGFFFPQAFLTATKQNFARKYKVPIDEVSFDFQVLDRGNTRVIRPPPDGVYIHGLFLEGAAFDMQSRRLIDSTPQKLFQEMPVIWLKPARNREVPTTGVYNCPVYKIGTRQGVLTTTGHSSNYVIAIELPSTESDAFWIKRGVALLCGLAR
jgi:dynein heavy chain